MAQNEGGLETITKKGANKLVRASLRKYLIGLGFSAFAAGGSSAIAVHPDTPSAIVAGSIVVFAASSYATAVYSVALYRLADYFTNAKQYVLGHHHKQLIDGK